MKMTSKILTSIISFFAGIIGMLVLNFPLVLLRLPVEYFYELIFSSGADKDTMRDLTSVFIVYSLAFFMIGTFVYKLFQKKFPQVNPFLTIPFAFPMVLGLFVMSSFGLTNQETLYFDLFTNSLISLIPLLAYIIGLIVTQRKQREMSTTPV